MKEHDLVLLTDERLDIPGGLDDIKRVVSADFMRSLLIKSNAMLGFVAHKNAGGSKDPTQ